MMSNPIEATHALANLPIGSRIVACGTEDDKTAYGLLLEHQEHRDGHAWIDLTNTDAPARTSGQIVAHFDDVVLVHRPDLDPDGSRAQT